MQKSATRSKAKRINDFQWIVEDLESLPSFVQMKMMGCELISLDGKQRLVLADKEEPWNGLLICTSHEYHDSLINDFPTLRSHSVLKKWLYLPMSASDFEETAHSIAKLVRRGDSRIGVEPKPKNRNSRNRKANAPVAKRGRK